MGGELKITARFPEGTVEINQFAAVGRTEDGDLGWRPRGLASA